jgi:hypothetical protein
VHRFAKKIFAAQPGRLSFAKLIRVKEADKTLTSPPVLMQVKDFADLDQ